MLVQLGLLRLQQVQILADLGDLLLESVVGLRFHLLRDGFAECVNVPDCLLRSGMLGLQCHLFLQVRQLAGEVLCLAKLSPLFHVFAESLLLSAEHVHCGQVGLVCNLLCERVELPGEVHDLGRVRPRRHVLSEGLHTVTELVYRFHVHLLGKGVAEHLKLLGELLCPHTRRLLGDVLAYRMHVLGHGVYLDGVSLAGEGDGQRLHLLRHMLEICQSGLLLHTLGQCSDLSAPQLIKAEHLVTVHGNDSVNMLDLAGDMVPQVLDLLPLLLQGDDGSQVLVLHLEPVKPLDEFCELGVEQDVQAFCELPRHLRGDPAQMCAPHSPL
mmetsp:Transcript_14787/g.34591  ORF Transcript_14787/g.34591 Transcript_14787/m.34591 type:complete len:326 (+) Transcript_14787:406-1383(+)